MRTLIELAGIDVTFSRNSRLHAGRRSDTHRERCQTSIYSQNMEMAKRYHPEKKRPNETGHNWEKATEFFQLLNNTQVIFVIDHTRPLGTTTKRKHNSFY